MEPPIETVVTHGPWFQLPSHWPAQIELLTWCEQMESGSALLLVLMGVVYLLFGYCMFKFLVLINAALIGAYFGGLVGQQFNAELPAALIGGFFLAALSWPLMKYALAFMGGILGGAIGASLWRTWGLDPSFAWSGAAIGVIFFSLLTFILFRGSVMMYTSLQGSVMLVFGLLGIIFKYNVVAPAVQGHIALQPFLLPACIFIPALLGLIYQQTQYPAKAEQPKA